MSDNTAETIHYRRQFLAPEETRYDQPYCQSYVYFDADPDGIRLESELIIGDGRDTFNLDYSRWDDDPDGYLAMVTKLMEQVIEYRQGFAEALARERGEALTRGGEAALFTVTPPEETP